MDYSEALKRLANHSNRPQGNSPETDSLSFVLWQADRDSRIPDLRNLCGDVLACFEAINHELNGQSPSKAFEGKAETLPRLLAGDVARLLSNAWIYFWEWTTNQRFTPEFRAEFGSMLAQLSMGWDSVLDGDINNIADDVRVNLCARYSLDAR
jgi:hypothetical protein